ncbi:MAG: hypothetical protein H7Z72_19935 [Bacteroidetes bacterium]|nr:hypothetical protein [Fibrella sp.]
MLTPKALCPLLLAAVFLVSGTVAAQNTPAPEWEPYHELGDLYPSFALAVANLTDSTMDAKDETNIGDPNGIMGIVFTPDRDDTRISVQLTCASEPKLFGPAMIEVTLPAAGEEYRITPVMAFDQAKLASIRQPTTVSVTYTVTINGQRQPPRTEPLRVHSINECPLVLTDDNDDATMDWVVAAYVDEDHPGVKQVLDEALAKRYVDSFVAYEGDQTRVYRQVLAVWQVLQERGNRYTALDANTSGGTRDVPVQTIQLADESVRNPKANCADGSVLMASILRKMGLSAVVVFIPGHVFVGFDLDEFGEKQVYLETTLLGVEPVYAPAAEKQLAEQLLGNTTDAKTQAAVRSFVAAIESANQTYAQHRNRIQDGVIGYAAVPIDDARQEGIRPIRVK